MIVLGDLHNNFGLINQLGYKNINIIQVGDFGLGFYPDKDEKTMDYWNTSWKARGIHVYAIRGNHDDPKYWDGRYDGRWSNLTLIPDYTVMQLEHMNYLFVGGAISVDRFMRKEGRDYWIDEEFVLDEDKLYQILEEYKNIDYVVTHTSPQFCFPPTKGSIVDEFSKHDSRLLMDLKVERSLVERMYNILSEKSKPKKWFYGHFHMNKVEYIEDVEFRLLGIGEITNV